ncbi:hypothetical protein PRUB_a3985 [Pseudoalteromonas rubra]|uniref:Aminoglycoside phosphotransferase domain-containing protein n=1 Tax=Pseudoalteromonas rubra TaxID=43658 RepID=A0A8T0C9R7_9GAMM|nr:phosphotransferase [Pseudoalteromonas rubra]KAF7787118.1 hypothetical protein PRUB_a3985 [Pseudoalteromonas rubra]
MFSVELTHFISRTLGREDWHCSDLPQGANNQGYKLSAGGKAYFLKRFAPGARALNKLHNEYQFSCQLSAAGITQIARPLNYCPATLSAIYEFIDGQAVEQITQHDISAAYDFIQAINGPNIARAALNEATDSPALLADFVHLITNRLTRFEAHRGNQDLDALLTQIETRTQLISATPGIDWQQACPKDVVSPSDFGFHNALKSAGQMYFIDFEYAGTDSSWKLLCDFFAQPALPVALSYLPQFLQSPLFKTQASEPATLKAIYELTLLKWCLIMLNEFLPDVQMRRAFSWNISCLKEKEAKLQQMQLQQLNKSKRYFEQIDHKIHQLQNLLRDS